MVCFSIRFVCGNRAEEIAAVSGGDCFLECCCSRQRSFFHGFVFISWSMFLVGRRGRQERTKRADRISVSFCQGKDNLCEQTGVFFVSWSGYLHLEKKRNCRKEKGSKRTRGRPWKMEEVTERVANLAINDTHKKNRIQVSNTKKPLFFYVNLAKVLSPSSLRLDSLSVLRLVASVLYLVQILELTRTGSPLNRCLRSKQTGLGYLKCGDDGGPLCMQAAAKSFPRPIGLWNGYWPLRAFARKPHL
jgi:hypothetical protein